MQNNYEEILEKNKILIFVPGGNSMWPTLKNSGQSVVVVPKTGRLKQYDVPLYKRKDGQYVLHRVMEVTPDGYVMCGDSQFNFEYGVTDDMIIGVMQGYYKGRKYIDASSKKSYRTALFLHKHPRIKSVAVRLYYFFRARRLRNEK